MRWLIWGLAANGGTWVVAALHSRDYWLVGAGIALLVAGAVVGIALDLRDANRQRGGPT